MSEIKIPEEFRRLALARPHYEARGWINFDCPFCQDRRRRGGILITKTGGVRYNCYNGGCQYNDQPAGWEPGSGFRGRIRTIFTVLGGDLRRIPMMILFKENRDDEQVINLEVKHSFPSLELPPRSVPLLTAFDQDRRSQPVAEYLYRRGEFYFYPEYAERFWWSSYYPDHLLIPFWHYQKRIVGYLGRNIYVQSGRDRFIQKGASDYVFDQHRIKDIPGQHLLVFESPMTAMVMQGVAIRNSRPTPRQVNLLRSCQKKPIMIPDFRGEEWKPFLACAEENEFAISVPEWNYKDAGEACTHHGVLWTLQTIMNGIIYDPKIAELRIREKVKKLEND